MRGLVAAFFALFVLPGTAVAMLVTYWLADRDIPVVVNRMWIEPKAIKACTDVEMWIERTALRQTGIRLEVFMTDSHEQSHIPLVTGTSALRGPVGFYRYSVGLHTPCTFKPGWVTVERRVSFYRNPLQRFIWPIEAPTNTAKFCLIADGQKPEEVCKTADRR